MQIGWNMVIETTNGIVGLWTCWLGNNFSLYYPLGVEIPDDMVMKTLGVRYAKPVADKEFGTRVWAKYYSRKLKEGRVWIKQESFDQYGYDLYTIKTGELVSHYCGHEQTNTIATYHYTFCSEEQPDAPNASPKYIQRYKKKFVELLVNVAKYIGDITAINLDSGLVLYTPEILRERGYKINRWRERNHGVKYEYCYTKDKDVEIILKSGNSLVPWITVIRYPVTNAITADNLMELVDNLNNTERPINLVPLIAYYLEQEKNWSTG